MIFFLILFKILQVNTPFLLLLVYFSSSCSAFHTDLILAYLAEHSFSPVLAAAERS